MLTIKDRIRLWLGIVNHEVRLDCLETYSFGNNSIPGFATDIQTLKKRMVELNQIHPIPRIGHQKACTEVTSVSKPDDPYFTSERDPRKMIGFVKVKVPLGVSVVKFGEEFFPIHVDDFGSFICFEYFDLYLNIERVEEKKCAIKQ